MANDFSSDSNCQALYKFETGAAFDDDSGPVGTNTLSMVNTPTEDATNYKEGAIAISLAAASAQYAKVIDANLSANFPLKSGDTSKLITISCWVRPTTVDANKRRIWSKYSATGNKRSLQLYHNSSQIYFQYSTAGTSGVEVSFAFGAMTANRWYHITLILDGVNKTWTCLVYDDTNSTWYALRGQTIANTVYASTAEFRIGADDDLAANTCFNGQIDELVVFNRLLNYGEVVKIKNGTFAGVAAFAGFCIDPVSGSDINSGALFTDAWKTLKKNFIPGDNIYVAKNVETSQAGTVTAGAFPALTLTTTNNLTGALAVYDIIRLTSGGVLDGTIYMIKAITSTTITLYRPYRGTVESGKTIYKLTVASCSSGDWTPTTGPGTAASHIILQGGINTGTLAQDGFTVLEGGGGSNGLYLASTKPFWEVSYLGFRNFNYSFGLGQFTDCILTKLFAFRGVGGYHYGASVRTVTNGIVFEAAPVALQDPHSDCIHNDWEIADAASTSSLTTMTMQNVIFNRPRIVGYGTKNCMNPGGSLNGVVFNDPVFDENNNGSNIFYMGIIQAYMDVIFNNPMFGSGTLFGSYLTPYGWLSFQNFGGVANDNRQYYFAGEAKYVGLLTRETTVYRTASPSGKVALNQSVYAFPVNFEIPCAAGVPITISAYLRKNSSYGSSTRPTMRLKWVTGTAGAYVWNQHDEVMSDTDDSFVQVSYQVTPAIQGVVKVDLLFQSLNSGAIGYFDDLAWAA
jgi:hypothetical protein